MYLLITLAPSHYAEKARWALDRAKLPYVEQCCGPGFHKLVLWRVGGRTVPTLVADDGRVFPDSSDILRFVDEVGPEDSRLLPVDPVGRAEVDALEDEIDEGVGRLARAWLYSWALDDSTVIRALFDRRLSAFHGAVLPVAIPAARLWIRRTYKLAERTPDEHFAALEQAWSRVDARFADGRRYLYGDRFSAADLTLAALGAATIGLQAFGGRAVPLQSRPAFARAQTETLAASPAGRHVVRMYAEHR